MGDQEGVQGGPGKPRDMSRQGQRSQLLSGGHVQVEPHGQVEPKEDLWSRLHLKVRLNGFIVFSIMGTFIRKQLKHM